MRSATTENVPITRMNIEPAKRGSRRPSRSAVPERGRPPAGARPRWPPAMASTAGLDAGPEVPGAEVGPDDVVQDLPRAGVGEARLEAVAHLDAHAALLAGHDEEDAVVDALPAELPGLEDAHRVVLDRVALEAVHREDRDLGARALLEVGQFRSRALPDLRRDDARESLTRAPRKGTSLAARAQGGASSSARPRAGRACQARPASPDVRRRLTTPSARRGSLAPQSELAGKLVPIVRPCGKPPGQGRASADALGEGRSRPALGACRPRCRLRSPPTRAASRRRRDRGRRGRRRGARTGRGRSGSRCGRECGTPLPRGRPALARWRTRSARTPEAPGGDAGPGARPQEPAQGRAGRRRQRDPQSHVAAPEVTGPAEEGRRERAGEASERRGGPEGARVPVGALDGVRNDLAGAAAPPRRARPLRSPHGPPARRTARVTGSSMPPGPSAGRRSRALSG